MEYGVLKQSHGFMRMKPAIMGLPDDYQDVTNSDGTVTSVPNAGHEGHMMGEYGGSVNQHEIDAIKKNSECPCDENQ